MTKNGPISMVHEKCGEGHFSWVVEQVQFGDILKYPNSDSDDPFVEETFKNGEVLGLADLQEGRRWVCTNCDEFVTEDNLVAENNDD